MNETVTDQTMNHTLFLHVETNVFDESGFPVSIAWSMPDTRIKSVLIIPEDEWLDDLDDQASPRNLDLENLYNQGASAIDIVREIERDLDGHYVYLTDSANQEALLEKLFDAAGADLPFEPQPAGDLFHLSEGELLRELDRIQLENHLDRQSSHDSVMALLFLARERGEI